MWNAMGHYGWGAGSGWGLLGMVPMVLWWAIVILGIVLLAKWLLTSRSAVGDDPGRRALDILAERYARGEIDKDEFEKRRRDLLA